MLHITFIFWICISIGVVVVFIMALRKKATVESVSALLQEVAQNQKETEQLIKTQAKEADHQLKETKQLIKNQAKETDLFIKENRRSTRELEELFTGQWGKLIESLVQGDLINLLKKRGLKVERTLERMGGFFKNQHGEQRREFDILAVNGDEVVVVEVKTTLKIKDVHYFLNGLKDFTSYCSEYKDKKIYGALAYLKANEFSNMFAEKRGLFVIRATGNSASIINSKEFKPKEF